MGTVYIVNNGIRGIVKIIYQWSTYTGTFSKPTSYDIWVCKIVQKMGWTPNFQQPGCMVNLTSSLKLLIRREWDFNHGAYDSRVSQFVSPAMFYVLGSKHCTVYGLWSSIPEWDSLKCVFNSLSTV